MKVLIPGLVIGLIIAAGFAVYAEVSLINLQSAYDALNNSHSRLVSSYQTLEANHTELVNKHKELLKNYENLSINYQKLKSRYNTLTENYTILRNNYSSLQTDYKNLQLRLKEYNRTIDRLRTWLSGNISKFTALVNEYEAKVNSLTVKNSELEGELSNYKRWLQSNITYYEDLTADLRNELRTYEEYVNKVETYTALITKNQSVRDAFLMKAMMSVSDLSADLGAYDPVLDAFEWILMNTYYQHDPSIPTYSWGLHDNVWKLPNETIDQEGGDCEDLALLAYSILKNNGVKAWLIFWWNGSESGHAAVIAMYGGNWYVIDPAGMWLNGNTIYLRMDVKDTSGKEYYIWISPLDITPDEKDWLITNGFAKVVWWDIIKDEEESNPFLPRYNTLDDTLNAWVNYWGYKFTGYSLMDIGVYKEFSSINDLVNYLRTHN